MNITATQSSAVSFPEIVRPTENSAATETPSASAPSSTEDTLEISGGGQLLGRLQSLFMDGAGADGVITMDELVAFRDKKLGETGSILQSTMTALGLDAKAKVKITIDPYNNVHAEGNLSADDRQQLETALRANDKFMNSYRAADSTATIVAAGEAYQPFAEAYAKDPRAAVAKFSWIFNCRWNFSLTSEKGNVSYAVTHQPKV